MATKVFTTIPGPCPFGFHNNIDDHLCRLCPYYYRAGTGTFFWCNHPAESVLKKRGTVPKTRETVPKAAESVRKTKKRGRPPGKATKKAVKRTKTKK